MSSKQFRFSFATKNDETSYGGSALKRIRRRPVLPRRPHHITLRASQAKGPWSFLSPKNYAQVHRILRRQAARHFIKLESFVNVGNHLHLKVRPQTRIGFANFLRSITCLIARAITGAKKTKPLKRRFFDALAWSRVILSRAEELILAQYFDDNALEAAFGSEVRAYARGLRQKKLQT